MDVFCLVFILYMFSLNSFLDCHECNDEGLYHYRDMYIVENVPTNLTTDERPFATLPTGLSIKPSSISKAGLGVWAEREFPKGTRFGPYGGPIRESIKRGEYAWQIYDTNLEFKYYVDAISKNDSNWVRYVNCANTIKQENLYLYQYNDEVYYVTYECILPGTELLVWYGEDYGEDLGLNRSAVDYQKRFDIDDVKYVIENSITENVSRLFEKCYKFYDRTPFRKPPGRFEKFDSYCLYEGSYLVCRYRQCSKNPCANRYDCGNCKGYCLHLGKYIKTGEQFEHADKSNTCICRENGHFGCTINRQSIVRLCS